ncbi:MAG: tRNA (N6-isopentenyl adenosine(37)-C2)-methylthiotransferase MiaB, partial [Alphaproteobacteria bacterium]|nr:tRNA (N6-isopentenyl adenosine(37)-C2)-methylthiotransferase MiaB [Alphaproteobacteria bacterium]
MNAYDSARMRDAMFVHGYQETNSPEQADILLLNTCHIREKASEKLFSEIGRLNEFKEQRKQEGKETLIVVCGCVVQAEGEEILKRSHLVDIALGPQNYHRLPELVSSYNRKKGRVLLADFPADSKFDYLPKTKATSACAFLAVQEGCDNFCTYCVVPYTRGCEYSRPADEIIQEAQDLVATGAKEIMLLGQNVNCWHGQGASDLGDLIRQLAQIEGLERIRYTTSYPSKITQNLIEAHKDLDKLMPYIHLPIQSGSDKILKAMNRQYTAQSYEEIVASFRKARPDIAVSSDFIVGFPGETEDDFQATMDVVKRVRYASSFS